MVSSDASGVGGVGVPASVTPATEISSKAAIHAGTIKDLGEIFKKVDGDKTEDSKWEIEGFDGAGSLSDINKNDDAFQKTMQRCVDSYNINKQTTAKKTFEEIKELIDSINESSLNEGLKSSNWQFNDSAGNSTTGIDAWKKMG